MQQDYDNSTKQAMVNKLFGSVFGNVEQHISVNDGGGGNDGGSAKYGTEAGMGGSANDGGGGKDGGSAKYGTETGHGSAKYGTEAGLGGSANDGGGAKDGGSAGGYVSPVHLSRKKGNKIDLIRVANAIYELGMVTDANGARITKKEYMTAFGRAFNIDLSDYDKDLSNSMSSSVAYEKQTRIFDEMKERHQEIYNSK